MMREATTTRWVERGVLAGALVLAVGLLGSCDSDTTDPAGNGEDSTTTIVATVTADGSPASDVTVDLYEEGGTTSLQTATTNGAGEAEFADVVAGTYELEVTVPSGYTVADTDTTRKSVTAVADQDATVSFSLVMQTANATDTVDVVLTNYAFTPGDLTIEPGTMVRWVNDTNTFHTITPDGHSEWNEGSVSSMGEMFTHTFTVEGTFPYYCSPHQSLGMTGTVTVQAP